MSATTRIVARSVEIANTGSPVSQRFSCHDDWLYHSDAKHAPSSLISYKKACGSTLFGYNDILLIPYLIAITWNLLHTHFPRSNASAHNRVVENSRVLPMGIIPRWVSQLCPVSLELSFVYSPYRCAISWWETSHIWDITITHIHNELNWGVPFNDQYYNNSISLPRCRLDVATPDYSLHSHSLRISCQIRERKRTGC